MRFSVFTASTPEWTPAEAARTLAEQGCAQRWFGCDIRVDRLLEHQEKQTRTSRSRLLRLKLIS